jgi:prepilin-type processing-associated H-X9-DG protein
LSVIAGGGKTLIEIPDATWDLPTMPRVPATGKLAGWTAGSEFDTDTAFALVGLTLADQKAAWPAKGSMIMSVDHDGDSKPGIKGVPKSDGGFLRPPTSILGQAAAVADQVYLVTRTVIALDGAMTSCSEQAGKANVMFFDNHVVGCHVYNGGECEAAQADFIDTNRTIYAVSDASYTSKFVSESATCAEVRAALPL